MLAHKNDQEQKHGQVQTEKRTNVRVRLTPVLRSNADGREVMVGSGVVKWSRSRFLGEEQQSEMFSKTPLLLNCWVCKQVMRTRLYVSEYKSMFSY